MPQSFADEFRSIPMSPNLGQSLERAHRFAREQAHRLVTLEHLLLALTDDPEAALILQSANVDLGRLRTDVSGYLGRLFEDMRADGAAEPRPDSELLRVLQAAASAAHQSRRRQIDGAIVLAAVVGDGKSPAAGLLKALGMTFEEAIRALQRANTKARLKPAPTPAPAQAPQAPAPRPRAEPEPAAAKPPVSAPAPSPEAAASETLPGAQANTAQSADDILAAARVRIQQRAAVTAGKPEPAPHPAEAPPAPAAPDEEAPAAMPVDAEPANAAETKLLTDAIQAAMTASAARVATAPPARRAAPPPADYPPQPAPAPVAPAAARPPTWTPPPEQHAPPPTRLPQPPIAGVPLPFPARPVPPGEGPRRPPLPPRAQGPHPQSGFPNRPPRAPWPEPGERGIPPRPAVRNGSYAEAPPFPSPPPPAVDRPGPAARPAQPPRAAPAPAPAPRGRGQGERAALLEHVPRRMRVGVPAAAEVRIARDRIEGLIATLSGRSSIAAGDALLTRALSVRLRALDGSFWIEPAAPETQWVESASSLIHDDYATWRWTVVPRLRGRAKLALMVSARTVGRDGVAAESSPPDRVIEVRVGANWRDAAGRWAGWITALLAGAVLGRFAEPVWTVARAAIRKTLGI